MVAKNSKLFFCLNLLHLVSSMSWALKTMPSPMCIGLNAPPLSIPMACLRLRGGSDDDFEDDEDCALQDEDGIHTDEDDDYDDYDSDSEDHRDYSDDENVRLSDDDNQNSHLQNRHPPRKNNHNAKQREKQNSQPSSILAASSIVTAAAKKSIQLTQKTAEATLVQTGRAAYHLATPKHVSRSEIIGTWRIDQQVGAIVTPSSRMQEEDEEEDLPVVTCAANVELTESGEAIVRYSLSRHEDDDHEGYAMDNKNYSNGEGDSYNNNQNGDGENEEDEVITSRSSYTFKERSWPRSCDIEFQLPAFHFPGDDHPVVMRYKGTFKRKLVDPSVIKIVGTIHEVGPMRGGNSGIAGGGMFWGGGKKKSRGGKKMDKETVVGTFTARRRIGLEEDQSGESEDYDEWEEEQYDDYDEEQEED